MHLRRCLRFCVLSVLTYLLLVQPGFSAERIYANYGIIGRSISVESLEIYAQTGELTDELASYSRYLTDEQLERLRTGLLTRAGPVREWRAWAMLVCSKLRASDARG